MASNSSSLLQQIAAFNTVPSRKNEAVFLAVHAIFLQADFFPVIEETNPTPGFAPSLRELPKGVLLPPSWSQTLSVQYKHRRCPGKIISFKMTDIDEGLVILAISLRKGDYASLELDLSQYTQGNENQGISYQNLEELQGRVTTVIFQLLPVLAEPPPSQSPSTLFATPPQPIIYPPNPMPASAPSIYNAGAADMDPFLSQGPPRLPPYAIPPGAGLGPSGGSLIGPDHDIFRGGGNYGGDYGGGFGPGQPPFLPSLGLPQPRFDPYGPVTGPNSDVNVGDVFPEGLDLRGMMAGRGRGRGRGNVRHPGEPNPDHFRPPGW